MSAVLCPLSLQTVFRDGRPVVGAKILIYEAGTTTPKTVYQDGILQASHPRPILTDGQGMVPPVYIGKGSYKLRLLTPGGVVISEVDGLAGAAASSDAPEPGETYPLADSDSVLVTGDIIASFRTGSRAGFARCNGNTLGSAASGASEIAVGLPSDQEQPAGSAYRLFVHLWESDANLPVYSAGVEVSRGATAIADWDANRQLGLPDARGRTLAGLDGMGGPDAERLQFQRALTLTKGSSEAYVTEIQGIVGGMALVGAGIAAGTVVNAIDGLKLTLSLPAMTAGSPTARFSQFRDARVLGTVGGGSGYELSIGQLPSHNHGASSASADSGEHTHSGWTDVQGNHQHGFSYKTVGLGIGVPPGQGNGQAPERGITDSAGAHSHNVGTHPAGRHSHAITTSIAHTGSNQSYSAVQPSLLLTWYIKL